MAEIYNNILKHINSVDPKVIYLAIGCALGHWDNITNENNQQHPPFMSKFDDDDKVTILIDPGLEKELTLAKLKPIIMEKENDKYRFYSSAEGNHYIHAINDYFYFKENNYDKESKNKYPYNYDFLIRLIDYVISNNSKLIVQDYSGRDISEYYMDFMDIFPKESLKKKVLFDVTQNDGGCFVDFSKFPIHYDNENNFIQIQFTSLLKLKDLNKSLYKSLFFKRFNFVTYYLAKKIRVLNNDTEYHLNEEWYFNKEFKLISHIYEEIKFKDNLTIEEVKNAITIILLDICSALDVPIEVIGEIEKNEFQQDKIISILSPVRAIINEILE